MIAAGDGRRGQGEKRRETFGSHESSNVCEAAHAFRPYWLENGRIGWSSHLKYKLVHCERQTWGKFKMAQVLKHFNFDTLDL